MFHGLGYSAVRRLAYEYAVQMKKTMPSKWTENECAGGEWMSCFMKRHVGLSLRSPEATSIARAQGFNAVAVGGFFRLLREVLSKHNYRPDDIYNLDESGITTVQAVPKVISQKGTKQVGQITATERGTLVTACCCVPAAGRSLSPALIFPRVNFKE